VDVIRPDLTSPICFRGDRAFGPREIEHALQQGDTRIWNE